MSRIFEQHLQIDSKKRETMQLRSTKDGTQLSLKNIYIYLKANENVLDIIRLLGNAN